jgi:UDP-GlcNAc:undecaprenyl-phosphate GlcNAc-1-phosphate transferase
VTMGSSVVIAATLGMGITVLLIPLALRWGGGAVMLGRRADWHHALTGPVPRLGGAVLAVTFVMIEAYIALFHSELRASTPGRDVIVAGSLAMFALGFWDDVRPLSATRKLLGQILVASVVCFCGVCIEVCRLPFTGKMIYLGVWGPVLTVVWLVSLTNLINLIDGVDGLAGGICLMLMILIAAVAHQNGNFELMASGMAGALAGFLCFNFPPARIYLGDGGAYFLGFQIGLYSLVNSHKGTVFAALVAPLFVLALPVTDALLTFARRGLRGLPLFRPDRKHIHHRLLGVWCSRRKVVLSVYALNLLFLLMGLAAFWSRGEWVPVLSGVAALLLFVCAGSFGFSRKWFAVHRVVRSSLRMRGEVQYALSLARWLELESLRHSSPAELWPDFVFAADKLGFDSLKLTLQGEHKLWRRRSGTPSDVWQRYDFPSGQHGSIEFAAPACPVVKIERPDSFDPHARCGPHETGCLADPQVFETISELLAEAWNRAAAQWIKRRIPLKFEDSMKTTLMLSIMFLVNSSLAGESLGTNDLTVRLRGVPAAELPAVSAGLVKRAKTQDRTVLAIHVVKAGVRINPAAASAIVGAITRAVPETAAFTARAGAEEQPDMAEAIVRAAAGIAPDCAPEIVKAVSSVIPDDYRSIALAAAKVAPSASTGILRAIGRIRPELRPYIDEEIAKYGRRTPSVSRCLARAEIAQARDAADALARKSDSPSSPQGGRPLSLLIPLDQKPPRGGEPLPGGRNYARP